MVKNSVKKVSLGSCLDQSSDAVQLVVCVADGPATRHLDKELEIVFIGDLDGGLQRRRYSLIHRFII